MQKSQKKHHKNHLYEIEGQMIKKDNTSKFELLTELKNQTIRYTLDGTEPNENSKVYFGPIPISES